MSYCGLHSHTVKLLHTTNFYHFFPPCHFLLRFNRFQYTVYKYTEHDLNRAVPNCYQRILYHQYLTGDSTNHIATPRQISPSSVRQIIRETRANNGVAPSFNLRHGRLPSRKPSKFPLIANLHSRKALCLLKLPKTLIQQIQSTPQQLITFSLWLTKQTKELKERAELQLGHTTCQCFTCPSIDQFPTSIKLILSPFRATFRDRFDLFG